MLYYVFFVADTQLYLRGFVHPLVRWSVGPLVRRSVGLSGVIELKTQKTRIYDAAIGTVCEGVLEGGLGWGWRLDAPAHPSATILWPRVTCFSDGALPASVFAGKIRLNIGKFILICIILADKNGNNVSK